MSLLMKRRGGRGGETDLVHPVRHGDDVHVFSGAADLSVPGSGAHQNGALFDDPFVRVDLEYLRRC